MMMSWLSLGGVYPRVYGGTGLPLALALGSAGLSPRVRGNQQQRRALVRNRRSIPACTGEPLIPGKVEKCIRVYPRVYGGTGEDAVPLIRVMGLSPRVRGNLYQHCHRHQQKRSIPACTGEPAVTPVLNLITRVYPRVYGGTEADGWVPSSPHGLSPRVRGNRFARAGLPIL